MDLFSDDCTISLAKSELPDIGAVFDQNLAPRPRGRPPKKQQQPTLKDFDQYFEMADSAIVEAAVSPGATQQNDLTATPVPHNSPAAAAQSPPPSKPQQQHRVRIVTPDEEMEEQLERHFLIGVACGIGIGVGATLLLTWAFKGDGARTAVRGAAALH